MSNINIEYLMLEHERLIKEYLQISKELEKTPRIDSCNILKEYSQRISDIEDQLFIEKEKEEQQSRLTEMSVTDTALEIIRFVKNGDLAEIQQILNQGWYVKTITPIVEHVAITGNRNTDITGDVYAYIVLSKNPS